MTIDARRSIVSWTALPLLLATLLLRPASAAVLLVPETYPTIQAAVDAAAGTDTVSVASGTYTGLGNRDIRIVDKSLLVQSREGPEATIIDCQQAGQAFFLDGWGYTPTIDGFTIKNGHGTYGGAIEAVLARPAIRHCRFEHNVGWAGGAVSVSTFAAFEDCVFLTNDDTNGGGGVCTLMGTVTFTRCLFADCYSQGVGGAIMGHGATLILTDCTLTLNWAAETGGGICSFAGDVELNNTICRGNACGWGEGGAIYAQANLVTLRCSDVWLAGVDAGQLVLEDVIDVDPLFCDVTGFDFTLQSTSPCLPAGNACGVTIGVYGQGCLGPAMGACCLTNGGCFISGLTYCEEYGGHYMGDGSSCQPNPCQPVPVLPMSWGRLKARFR
jgi:hypothetical protein